MNQQEFYNTVAVKAAIELQKQNPYGSELHRQGHKQLCDAAKLHGVWNEFKKSHGDKY